MSVPPRTALVDLGLGNLHSVARSLEAAGADVVRVGEPSTLRGFDRIVVPGQGAFRDGAAALEAGWRTPLLEALHGSTPLLGICIGMQLLFAESEEAPGARGLGFIPGRVRRFPKNLGCDPKTGAPLKVPHMGWNQLSAASSLLGEGTYYYFVHSYFCELHTAAGVATLGTSETEGAGSVTCAAVAHHGIAFCAALAQGPLLAVQFHPEKSHHAGARLLRSFLRPEAASAQ